MGRQTDSRILIVTDGKTWFIRSLLCSTHDLERNEKVYRCDKHLGGPFKTLMEAAKYAHECGLDVLGDNEK